MPLLTRLDDWSLDVVRQLVVAPEGEPGWFDFKEHLTNKHDPNASKRLCETACAMANTTGGGFIVLGVKNKGATPDERMVGIPLNGEERRDFGQAIDKVRPSIRFDAKVLPLPSETGRGIVIVQIVSDDALRPHMNEHDGAFYQRGDSGRSMPMSYQQVRDAMMLGQERRQRIMLFAAKLYRYAQMASTIEQYAGARRAFDCLLRFDTINYDNLLGQIMPSLPSDWWLQELMNISESANWINTALAVAISAAGDQILHDLTGEQYLALGSAARDIKRWSYEGQKRLDELFGPLPAGIPKIQGY